MIKLLFTSVKFATETEKAAKDADPALAAHLDAHSKRWAVQVRFDLPTDTPADVAKLTAFDGVLASMFAVAKDKRRQAGIQRLRGEIAKVLGTAAAPVAAPVAPAAPAPVAPEPEPEPEPDEPEPDEPDVEPEESEESESEADADADAEEIEPIDADEPEEKIEQEIVPCEPFTVEAEEPASAVLSRLDDEDVKALQETPAPEQPSKKAHLPSDDPGPISVVSIPTGDKKASVALAKLFEQIKKEGKEGK